MAPELVRTAIAALAGCQVTDVEELYGRIGGESRPDAMPRQFRRGLGELLKILGYRERWVRGLNGERMGFRWVRDPWPIDVEALLDREVATYTNFD
jgi:hypothetical protein